MMGTFVSQIPEDVNRNKIKNRMVTRGTAAENRGNTEKAKTVPPVRKSELAPKKVVIVEPHPNSETSDVQQTSNTETSVKKKALPYVDVPSIKTALRDDLHQPVKRDQSSKYGPAYKTQAPVEIGVDIERLVETVLDLEITVPLRSLAGVSGAVQKEIRKQVTKARQPIESSEVVETNHLAEESSPMTMEALPMKAYVETHEATEDIPEGHLVGYDPVLQYVLEHGDDVIGRGFTVASDRESLRAIHMKVNGSETTECLLDNGSMIVAMAKRVAIRYGLHWDPSVTFNMESASGDVKRTLGLAKNVPFVVAGMELFLQVHILEDPPYGILMGRPFETLTNCTTHNKDNGDTEVVLTDPNSGQVVTVPTYPRGQGPTKLKERHYLNF